MPKPKVSPQRLSDWVTKLRFFSLSISDLHQEMEYHGKKPEISDNLVQARIAIDNEYAKLAPAVVALMNGGKDARF